MEKVIVTGSSGFLGRRLCETWTDVEIVRVDLRGKVDYNIDLCNLKELNTVVETHKPELIVHLAAYSAVVGEKTYAPWAFDMLGRNVMSTYNVLEVALNQCPVIIAGSAAEYGNWPEDINPPYEHANARPVEPYGISKYLCSLMVHDRTQVATVLRFSNLFGPRQRDKFIPMLIETALAGRKLSLHGGGQQTRQWLYVDDAVNSIKLVAEKLDPLPAYNITAPEELRIKDVALQVYQELQDQLLKKGKNIPLLDLDLVETGGGSQRVCMESKMAMADLKWAPQVSFEEGVRLTVQEALK